MYDIVPDLLKAYYISLCAAFVLGAFIGFGLCYLWLEREKPLVEPDTELKPYPGKYDVNAEVDMILEALEQ